MISLSSLTLTDSECSCAVCQNMCQHRPCWPTPVEVRKLIAEGYSDRLMVDWWCDDSYDDSLADIPILCPAGVGHEKDDADEGSWLRRPDMRCNLLTKDNLCSIHHMKPTEGRCVNHVPGGPGSKVHEAVAESWNNPEARKLVWEWVQATGYNGRFLGALIVWAKSQEKEQLHAC